MILGSVACKDVNLGGLATLILSSAICPTFKKQKQKRKKQFNQADYSHCIKFGACLRLIMSNDSIDDTGYHLANCWEGQKRLTRSTLLKAWSCTWRRTSRCPGRSCWWPWGRCSWGCSSCCHTGATAARWSWRRTGSGGTRRWWRCSRSQRTGRWRWLCIPHLQSQHKVWVQETNISWSFGFFRWTVSSLQWEAGQTDSVQKPVCPTFHSPAH